jgi:carbonic anhydrase
MLRSRDLRIKSAARPPITGAQSPPLRSPESPSMRILVCLCTGLALAASATVPAARRTSEPRAQDEALLDPLERLKLGNQRFQSGKAAHFNEDAERRLELARQQHPFVAVVACTDARVPPELVFDQGLGDLFVVRTSGEALDDLALASLEFAIERLGVRTIVVLGHQGCEVVTAALLGGRMPGHLEYLARAILPHVAATRARLPAPAAGDGDSAEVAPELFDAAVSENVRAVVAEIEDCGPILSELQHTGELRVVGARYDLESGIVEWLPTRVTPPARPAPGGARH